MKETLILHTRQADLCSQHVEYDIRHKVIEFMSQMLPNQQVQEVSISKYRSKQLSV